MSPQQATRKARAALRAQCFVLKARELGSIKAARLALKVSPASATRYINAWGNPQRRGNPTGKALSV